MTHECYFWYLQWNLQQTYNPIIIIRQIGRQNWHTIFNTIDHTPFYLRRKKDWWDIKKIPNFYCRFINGTYDQGLFYFWQDMYILDWEIRIFAFCKHYLIFRIFKAISRCFWKLEYYTKFGLNKQYCWHLNVVVCCCANRIICIFTKISNQSAHSKVWWKLF